MVRAELDEVACDQAHHGPVGNADPLGPPRRPRGERHVGQVLRADAGVAEDRAGVDARKAAREGQRGEPGGRRGPIVRDERDHIRGGEQLIASCLRRASLHGEIRAAGIEDPEQRGDQMVPALHLDGDDVLKTNPVGVQPGGDATRTFVQLRVREITAAVSHCHPAGIGLRRACEEVVEQARAQSPRERATMLRSTSDVPEWMRPAIESRTSRSSSYSVMKP